MSKYYIAPNKRGRLIKIVEDVKIRIQGDKLSVITGCSPSDTITKQALIARFVNEDLAAKFLDAYNQVYGEEDEEREGRTEKTDRKA